MKRLYVGPMWAVVLLAVSILIGTGCGFKTPPVPPQNVVPKPIVDLLYSIDGQTLTLNWSYPVETVKGGSIEEVKSFDLYFAEIALEDYCGTCPIPFGEPLEIDGGAVLDGKQRSRASHQFDSLKSGYKYFVKVRSRTSWFADSGDSNIVTFVYYQPAAIPESLAATPGDGEIKLSWQPVSALMDGSKLPGEISYQLYRSSGGKELIKLGEPLFATSYVDRPLVNGQKYFYAVESLMAFRGEQVQGGRSAKVSAVPVDMTPPLAPTGVAAVATGVGVKIFWDKSPEADIGGYRVYRRKADGDSYESLGKVEPQFNLFVDSTGKKGTRYYYSVTAFDRSSPPNESGKSKEATIR